MNHDVSQRDRQPGAPGTGEKSPVAPGRSVRTSELSNGASRAQSRGAGALAIQRSADPSSHSDGSDWTNAVFRPDLFSQPVQRKEVPSSTGSSGAIQRQVAEPGASAPAQRQVSITASALNVRSSPGVAPGNKVGRLENGAVVTVVAEQGGWFQIEYQSGSAFISARYTEPVASPAAAPVPDAGPAAGQSESAGVTGAGVATGDNQEAEADANTDANAARQVRVTASALNVRSAPQVSAETKLGVLDSGAVVTVVGERDGWLQIDYQGGTGFISARYVETVATSSDSGASAGATASSTTTTSGNADPAGAEATATAGASGAAAATASGAAAATESGAASATGDNRETATDASGANERFGTIVRNLVNDYQNVPVWNPGQSADEEPAGTFVTPYVLNYPQAVQTALRAERNTHQSLATRGGGTVSGETGNRPFVGKGTPAECQIVAQAAIDASLTTVGGIQAYINNGPMNSSGSRQNGRWGVDCSGFTAIAASEMAGGGRDVSGNRRSTEYRPGGSALTNGGYSQVSGDDAQAGDVVSYMTTNHVVVVYERQDVTIANTEGEARPAVMLRVGESSGSGIRATNTFWHVPDAARYGNTTPRTSPDVHLLRRSGETRPSWEAYRDGFRVLTGGFNLNRYSIVRPPANQEPDETAAADE